MRLIGLRHTMNGCAAAWFAVAGEMALLLGGGCTSERPGVHELDKVPVRLVRHNDRASPEIWPGWRGAAAHGVSPSQRLPVEWSSSDAIIWKQRVVGSGNSSPVVWHDRVVLTSLVPGKHGPELTVFCFDRDRGDLLWQYAVGAPRGTTHGKNGFASATPAVDERHVYCFFGANGLICLDWNGSLRWQVPLDDLDQRWGMASSPLLFENCVIQLCDGEGPSYLLACDKDHGSELWRTERNSSGCWTTPVLLSVADGDESRYELIVNGTGSRDGSNGVVNAYDPIHGGVLWSVRGTSDIPIPSMMVGPRIVISSSGPNGPLFAIRPGGRGDVTDTHVLWHYPSGGAGVVTGVIYDGHAYFVSGRGVVTCRDLRDGRLLWRNRIEGDFSASLMAGGGLIYATSEQGQVYVFEAADGFRLVATNTLAERCLATPAVADGDLYMRTAEHLIRIGSTPGEARKVIALAE